MRDGGPHPQLPPDSEIDTKRQSDYPHGGERAARLDLPLPLELSHARASVRFVVAEIKLAPARLWWVNQGSTYGDERSGGYVFAPQYATNGRTVPHWQTLMLLQRGDAIVHYANGFLRSLSQVIEPYRIAQRPIARPGFDAVRPGYLVRVAYYDAATPIALDEIPDEWRSEEGGPFTHSGRVRQGYLFPRSEAFKRRFLATFGNRWAAVTVPGWA